MEDLKKIKAPTLKGRGESAAKGRLHLEWGKADAGRGRRNPGKPCGPWQVWGRGRPCNQWPGKPMAGYGERKQPKEGRCGGSPYQEF